MPAASDEIPFLKDREGARWRDESHEEESLNHGPAYKQSWIRRQMMPILGHMLLLVSYTVVALTIMSEIKTSQSSKVLYSPANTVVQYEKVVINDSPADVGRSRYVGAEPTPEQDAEWYKLLHYHNIRLTDHDLREMNISSVPLGTGGYQGMLGVMHELHCLKLVREGLHPEHYYKDKTESEIKFLKGHNEHCIDALRMATMCRPDLAVFPFHWIDGTRLPAPTWSQNHQCANWDRLREWLDTRVVDVKAPGVLTHPKYGPSYPGGERISEPDGPKVILP